MSITVYRKGNTHTVRGVECELMLISPEYFTGEAPKGWFLTLDDLDVDKVEVVAVEEPVEDTIQKEINIEKLTNKETRYYAELNDIENFDDARIKTLKGKLKKCQEKAILKVK